MGQVFEPDIQVVGRKGLITTDMWDIFVDSWEPYVSNYQIYPEQLHQSEVWDMLGIPDGYTINRSDMYVFAYEYLVIYYDDFGYSQVVLWLPDSTYQ